VVKRALASGRLRFGPGQQEPQAQTTENDCQSEQGGGGGRLCTPNTDHDKEGGEEGEDGTNGFLDDQHLMDLRRQRGGCRKGKDSTVDIPFKTLRQDGPMVDFSECGWSLSKLTIVGILRGCLVGERLREVVDEILRMFKADGDSHGFFRDSRGCSGFRGHRGVAHGGGEGDQALDSAERFRDVEEF
jgi:hypothetical protein